MPTEVSKVIDELEETRDEIAQIIRGRGSYIAPNTKLKELVPYIRSFAQPELEEGTVTPASVSFDAYPSKGYVGFSKVTVNPIPYQRKDTDVTVDGATVNIPYGYYRSNVTKSVASGSATTPADTIEATNTVTIDANGLITATASGSKSITPTVSAGYVSSGTAGTVSVSGTGTKQLTKRTSSSLTASGLTVTAPAGYYHSKASKTLTDSNLIADNIKKGVTIFGVTGTHEGGASVTTCTINVKFTTNAGNCLTSATTFANGAFSAFNSTTKSGTFTIQNVVCGSALSIGTTAMCSLYWSGSQQAHMSLYGGMITVPATSGTYTVEVGVLDD